MECSIIGLTARFSGDKNLDDFWQALATGESFIKEVSSSRFELMSRQNPVSWGDKQAVQGMYLDDIDTFDRQVFPLSSPAIMFADPRQRMLLEACWKAIEDAGLDVSKLSGQKVGVFIAQDGWFLSAYVDRIPEEHSDNQEFIVPGNDPCFLANRISFFFNFVGPSKVVDTTCSSSYVALDEARHALANGDCDYALVGGVSLFLNPWRQGETSATPFETQESDVLSFTDKADGYKTSEGCAAILLTRASQAVEAQHHVYANVIATGHNAGGRTNSFAHPSESQQSRLFKEVLAQGNVSAEDIQYVEAHGVASHAGDVVEANALNSVFSNSRQDGAAPCHVSTIKPNIGHNHASSGLYAIIKVLLALKHDQIPKIRSLEYYELNHEISVDETSLRFNNAAIVWSEITGNKPRKALLTSYGFSSVNAAVILQESSSAEPEQPEVSSGNEIICLSAQTEHQLLESATALLHRLDNPRCAAGTSLKNISWTLSAGRKTFSWRWATIVDSVAALKERLKELISEPSESLNSAHFKGFKADNRTQTLPSDSGDAAKVSLGKDQYSEQLEFLAKEWTSGAEIDWEAIRFSQGLKRVPLHTYPFAKDRYWVPASTKQLAKKSNAQAWLHPFVHENTSNFSEQRFSTLFDGTEFCLEGHVIHKIKVLPGVGHLELARAAAHECYNSPRRNPASDNSQEVLSIRNVVWANIIGVTGDPKQVHARFVPNGKGEAEYQLYSQNGDNNTEEVIHNSGTVSCKSFVQTPVYDIPAILNKLAANEYSPKHYYDMYLALGLYMALDYQGIERLFVGADKVLAKLSLPASLENTRGQFVLHPCLMDGALLSSVGLLMKFSDLNQAIPPKCLIPFALDEIEFYDEVSTIHWAWISYSEGCSARDPFPKVDVECCDENGKVCIRFNGFSCRGFGDQNKAPADTDPYLLKPVWKMFPFPNELPPVHTDHHLVVYSQSDIASHLVESLNASDKQCIAIPGFKDPEARQSSLSQIAAVLSQAQLQAQDSRVLLQLLVAKNSQTPEYAGVFGALRATYQMNNNVIGQIVEIGDVEDLNALLTQERSITQHEAVRLQNNSREIATWAPLECTAIAMEEHESPWHHNGAYLVFSDQGGLANWVIDEIKSQSQSATCIEAVVESGVVTKVLTHENNRVVDFEMPQGQDLSIVGLVTSIGIKFNELNGVFYCIGEHSEQTGQAEPFEHMSKTVDFLRQIDVHTQGFGLDFFCVVANRDGLLGSTQQIAHAAKLTGATQFIEERTVTMSASGKLGQSLALLLPWVELTSDDISAAKMVRATLKQAFSEGYSGQLLMMEGGDIERFRLDMLGTRICFEASSEFVTPPSDIQLHASVTVDEQSTQGQDLEQKAIEIVKSVICPAVGLPSDEVGLDIAMDSFGIDSILSIKMTEKLEEHFGRLPKTLFFEYLTVRELAGFFVKKHASTLSPEEEKGPFATDDSAVSKPQAGTQSSAALLTNPMAQSNEQLAEESQLVAIVGLSGKFPQANNMDEFWTVLKNGEDCITEIPNGRWDHSEYFDLDKSKKGTSYSRWGGFVDGIDEFDPLFFNLSPRDARLMSPQERLFVQCAYGAMEDAGYTHKPISGRKLTQISDNIGVYVGVMYGEYEFYSVEEIAKGNVLDQSIVTGSFGSIANRVSQYFNLRGPSLAVDTMCSSSLTAIHQACKAIQNGECDAAIAGGVNLTVHPNKYLILSQSQFLSDNGKCLSFGAGGSGYVPSEGVGAVLLKPLSKAKQDGDQIYAVIRGTSINHGGKTNGYTVPNPVAQASAIESAIQSSGLPVSTVGYIEAHGTGTSLGDPIEMAGLEKAFDALGAPSNMRCAIGSVKSNIGHCESAAGIAGLAKVLLQMKHQKLVPSIHSTPSNPSIDFDNSKFYVQTALADWPTNEFDTRVAGISSFGAGGSNAHLLVEQYVPQDATTQDKQSGWVVIPISARTQERLGVLANNLREYIVKDSVNAAASPFAYLEQVAKTLQLGREEMEHRATFVTNSVEELLELLASYVAGTAVLGAVWHGTLVSRNPNGKVDMSIGDASNTMEYRAQLAQVAARWVEGAEVDWARLYATMQSKPTTISLPTYPFEQNSYWVPKAIKAAAVVDVIPTHIVDQSHIQSESVYFTGEWVDETLYELSHSENNQSVDLIVIGSLHEDALQQLNRLPHVSSLQCLPVSEQNSTFYTSLISRLVKYCQAWAKNQPLQASQLVVLAPWKEFDVPLQGLFGALRTIQMEHSQIRTRLIFNERLKSGFDASVLKCVEQEVNSSHDDVSMIYFEGGRRAVWRSKVLDLSNTKLAPSILNSSSGVIWIVGGLGGLGLQLTRFFSKRTGAKIIISGRRKLDANVQSQLDELAREGVSVAYLQCNINSWVEIERTALFIRNSYGKLSGVVNCAGTLADKLTVNKSEEDLVRVLSVKVNATMMLDEATKTDPLSFFLLCSSLASWGNVGQIDYAAANAFLDSFAHARNEKGALGLRRGKCISICWPLLRNGGMQVSAEVEQQMFSKFGIRPLEDQRVIDTLELAFQLPYSQLGVMCGDRSNIQQYLQTDTVSALKNSPVTSTNNESSTKQTVAEIVSVLVGVDSVSLDCSRKFADYGMNSISLADMADQLNKSFAQSFSQGSFLELDCVDKVVMSLEEQTFEPVNSSAEETFDVQKELGHLLTQHAEPVVSGAPCKVMQAVLSKLSELLGKDSEQIDLDRTFGQYGIDSIGLSELSEHVNKALDVHTSSATLLELDTANKLIADLRQNETLEESSSSNEQMPAESEVTSDPSGFAIIGYDCTFPGADNAAQYWQNLTDGALSFRTLDTQEWAKRGIQVLPGEETAAERMRHSGYLNKIDLFDADFWGIDEDVANQMDPQQRLLMRSIWRCIENAGYSAKDLARSRVGLFVAVDSAEYKSLIRHSDAKVGLQAGLSLGMMVNQVSHYFDFRGPSEIIDNACASVFVGVKRAQQAIKNNECDIAIVAGVKVMLDFMEFFYRDQGGILSQSGRVAPFDIKADGYIRGEGVGSILLKPMSAAMHAQDPIQAIIRSVAVSQNGKNPFSSMAPNVDVQSKTVQLAYEQADIDPMTVGYIEAHGSATSFNDACEIVAFKRLFENAIAYEGDSQHQCVISSVKGNIGHLEAASGIASIIKVILAMKQKAIPPIASFSSLPKSIRIEGSPLVFPTNLVPWKSSESGILRAGLNSIGITGVNSHLILESPRSVVQKVQLEGYKLVVISARSEQALKMYWRKWLDMLQGIKDSPAQATMTLQNLAYSSQVGREAMPFRSCFIVQNIEQLVYELSMMVQGNTLDNESMFSASGICETPDSTQAWNPAFTNNFNELKQIATRWLTSSDLDWRAFSSNIGHFVAIPNHPFIERRYWLTKKISMALESE